MLDEIRHWRTNPVEPIETAVGSLFGLLMRRDVAKPETVEAIRKRLTGIGGDVAKSAPPQIRLAQELAALYPKVCFRDRSSRLSAIDGEATKETLGRPLFARKKR